MRRCRTWVPRLPGSGHDHSQVQRNLPNSFIVIEFTSVQVSLQRLYHLPSGTPKKAYARQVHSLTLHLSEISLWPPFFNETWFVMKGLIYILREEPPASNTPHPPDSVPEKSWILNRVLHTWQRRMFFTGLLSYSNTGIYMQIINAPITNYLVLFIKAELQFIKAGTKTNVLVVSRIHSPQRKMTPQKLSLPARKEK